MKSNSSSNSRPLAWLGLALLTLASVACAVETPPSDNASSANLLPPIKALIGDAACDGDAQCHSLGIGAKACGGPSGYLAWSSRRTDGAELNALAARHAKTEREAQERSGMLSNCQFLPDPGARCVTAGSQRKCQLNTGAVGAS